MLFDKGLLAAALLAAQVAGRNLGLPAGLSTHNAPRPQDGGAMTAAVKRDATYGDSSKFRYLNNKTSKYQVKSLPGFDFDLGELYAGNIPIDKNNSDRSLWFMFQPTIGKPVDEILIMYNLVAATHIFQRDGRFLWYRGTTHPVQNPYSFVNLTNVLWVDGSPGIGYSQGNGTAKDHAELAEQFLPFYKKFQDIFGIKNYKTSVVATSELSKMGVYVTAAMLKSNDTRYFNVKSTWLPEPYMGPHYDYYEAVMLPWAKSHLDVIPINSTRMQLLEEMDQKCGYREYREKYFKFPASGVQPSKPDLPGPSLECDILQSYGNATFDLLPCFDQANIALAACPVLSDFLFDPDKNQSYLERKDVREALHATKWNQFQDYPFDYYSTPSTYEGVLPQIIEGNHRVLLSTGDLNLDIIPNGTLLCVQNMTWGGKLGFQQEPTKPIVLELPDLDDTHDGFGTSQRTIGTQHYERGLLWAKNKLGGFDAGATQPRMAYRQLQWVLGRIDEL